jgi:ABC-type polysaccharide transport system permease subunit
VGNLDREHARILAPIMDCLHVLSIGHIYNADFKFDCRLKNVTNHTREGYAICIVLYSNNSDSWTDSVINYLRSSDVSDVIKL